MDNLLLEFRNTINTIEHKIYNIGGWYIDDLIDEEISLIGVVSKNSFTEKELAKLDLNKSDVYTTYKQINADFNVGIFHDVDSDSTNNIHVFIELNPDLYDATRKMAEEMKKEIHKYIPILL